jgi:hypothetical protein
VLVKVGDTGSFDIRPQTDLLLQLLMVDGNGALMERRVAGKAEVLAGKLLFSHNVPWVLSP